MLKLKNYINFLKDSLVKKSKQIDVHQKEVILDKPKNETVRGKGFRSKRKRRIFLGAIVLLKSFLMTNEPAQAMNTPSAGFFGYYVGGRQPITKTVPICNPYLYKNPNFARAVTGINAHPKFPPFNKSPWQGPRKNLDRYFKGKYNCTITHEQIVKKYKHATDFGIVGGGNSRTFEQYKDAIENHMKNSTVTRIEGTYRKNVNATHYLDKETKINVVIERGDTDDYLNNTFLTAFELSDDQFEHLMTE